LATVAIARVGIDSADDPSIVPEPARDDRGVPDPGGARSGCHRDDRSGVPWTTRTCCGGVERGVYEEPPAKQIYRGRAALFEFFGGYQKLPMVMRWHHIAFDETTQTGFGEYTFKLTGQYHGIVVVRVRDGLITHWREYQYKSDLPYDEFARATRF
jgi:hypothetical protein